MIAAFFLALALVFVGVQNLLLSEQNRKLRAANELQKRLLLDAARGSYYRPERHR